MKLNAELLTARDERLLPFCSPFCSSWGKGHRIGNIKPREGKKELYVLLYLTVSS